MDAYFKCYLDIITSDRRYSFLFMILMEICMWGLTVKDNLTLDLFGFGSEVIFP